MSTYELFIIAVGLSMDALAVAICKGLSMAKMSWRKGIIVGLWFGGFQALMPLIGYLLGAQFESKITAFDHWIAFILLGLIGGNMIREGVSGDEEKTDDSVSIKSMLPLAIATSIDALASSASSGRNRPARTAPSTIAVPILPAPSTPKR